MPKATETARATTALLLLLPFLALLCACQGGISFGGDSGASPTPGPASEEAVPVEVLTVKRGRIEQVLRFSANLEAERQVQVFAEAQRRVVELLVEEGDQVAKGQLLLRLEDDVQRTNLAKVESQLRRAERELTRQQDLFAQHLISEQVFNEADYETEQLQLALDDAKRDLSFTEVHAAIAGTVSERLVNLGDHVTLSQPLFRIVDFDSIVARIYVPEKELASLGPGQATRLTAEALGRTVLDGAIERIAPVVDPATGTVKVTVATPHHPGLRPGMYVVVELVTAVREDAVLLPKRSLIYDNDQIFAFRLAEHRRVERLVVEILIESTELVQPAAGFAAGDSIVVAGQSGLKDGALVRLPGDPEKTEAPEQTDQAKGDGDGDGTDTTADGEQR